MTNEPINLEADQLEFIKETGIYKAEGHLKIIQGKRVITGRSVEYNQETGDMAITGDVLMVEENNQIRAEKMILNIKQETGVVYRGHLIFGIEHYHVDGNEIRKTGPKEFRVSDATVTTCECNQYADKPPSSPWRIRSTLLLINEEKYVKGRNVFFEIKNIPVLYSPYLYIPITKERQSGFLIPQVSYNSSDGIGILQPYYWAFAQNQDLTLSLDYRSLRGTGSNVEYRYVNSASSGGTLFTRYFKDVLSGSDRSEIRYQHIQTFSEHVNTRINLNYVSDQSYFKDLSIATSDISQRSVESNIYLSGKWDNQTAYLLTRFTRDLSTQSDLTIQKLPEIGYAFHTSPVFSTPLYFDLSSTATYFYQEAGLRVGRGDIYFRLTDEIPLPHLGILTPRAGLRKTVYSRGIRDESMIERTVSDYGIGYDSSLSRVYPGEDPLTHVIESSLSYEYVPPVDQTNIPFMDNIDLIPDKNLFTYSLTNRLIRKEEVFYFKLTDSYLVNPTEGRFSDLRSEMKALFYGMKLKTDSFYNFYSGSVDMFNGDLWFDSPGVWDLALGERFSKSGVIPQKGDIFNPLSLGLLQSQPLPIRYWTSSLRIHLTSQLTVATKLYFDSQNGILSEGDYGIRYLANCWGMTLGFVQFPDRNQISFAVDLTGLGGSGNSSFFRGLFGN
ncbi:MAG: LPS-assembly protein LptD [Nitrospirae bacterium]|nr:LPS-assembly protein LptD [Nitrospirota bacterium]MBI3594582.1 LPS-assembly protein LptD [Nitrospirota bacterium]